MTASAKILDWIVLCFLVILWGSAYAMTRLALNGLSPIFVVSARLWIGAGFLFITCLVLRKRIPSIYDIKSWGLMAATGIVGSLIPFFLISLAQTHVASALASIYLSATPMAAAILAHFFIAGEKIGLKNGAGVALGILGVVILFAPSLLQGTENSPLWAQFILVFAAICYGAALIIVRLTSPKIDPIAISFGFVFCSALVSTPFAFVSDTNLSQLAAGQFLSLLGLGIGPTALASILYVRMVHIIGPVMVANFSNLVPFVSIAIGFFAFNEQIPATAGLALMVILGGVYLVNSKTSPSPLRGSFNDLD